MHCMLALGFSRLSSGPMRQMCTGPCAASTCLLWTSPIPRCRRRWMPHHTCHWSCHPVMRAAARVMLVRVLQKPALSLLAAECMESCIHFWRLLLPAECKEMMMLHILLHQHRLRRAVQRQPAPVPVLQQRHRLRHRACQLP